VDDELEQELEEDFELGEIFKTRLIKHAVDWYTGKALEYEGPEGDDDDDPVRAHAWSGGWVPPWRHRLTGRRVRRLVWRIW
jgi:hypothetical protein